MYEYEIGLIVNPAAGQGATANAAVAQQALTALAPERLWVGEGEMGAALLEDLSLPMTALDTGPHPGKARTLYLAEQLARQGVDFLLVVGGDGTMADVALALVESGQDVPILGVGVGSTNVGGLITCRQENVSHLAEARPVIRELDCLLASCNGELLGIGFNDCVIGFTVVATIIDSRLADVRVAEKMQGLNVQGTPQAVWTAETRVIKRSASGETLVAEGQAVGTVMVGLAESRFFGKAVTGGVCLTALVGLPAGCLVCDQPLVRVQVEPRELLKWEPLSSRYVSLEEKECIVTMGVCAGAALCADGNPLIILDEADVVEMGVRRRAIKSMQLSDG